MSLEKVLYRAHAHATGGRDGRSIVPEGKLDFKLTTPRELGGTGGEGTNPEQLFAAGYSACFLGAIKFVASREKISLPADVAIDGSVGIGPIPTGFGIEVASQQPHAMAVLQVERRDEAHQAIARKFCSIRAPTAAERSG